jgi:hypothetical protein
VDLVRNYTSTTGTGNFEPGAAVAGYRSFAAEIQPGESFYYSVLGIDKPDEFEIGRGTMQADGTISREAIGGTLTDFTAGTKSVALVAAAEWYRTMQSDSAATVRFVDSRDALAELDDRSRPALLLEKGREGIFAFDPSDRSGEVAVDQAQGLYIAPSSDLSGASGAWVRKYEGGADPRWFGAAMDGITDDRDVFAMAVTVARHVRIPRGLVMRSTGTLLVPDGAFIEGGGTIEFDAINGTNLFMLSDDIRDVRIEDLKFTCSSDVSFAHIVRMVQNPGTTLDGFDFVNNVIESAPTTGPGSGDRWVIAGSGSGFRKHVRINGNRLIGPMQLVATPVATGTFEDSEICFNRIHNARTNAISLLGSGIIGADRPCTLKNVKVTDNVITADDYTSLGIAAGIDDTGNPDVNMNIQGLTIARNTIDISASPISTADIWIKIGTNCAALGGFDSINDDIVIDDNQLSFGLNITTSPISSATQGQITNYVQKNNRFLGGSCILAYLADGAMVIGNTHARAALVRLSKANGTIHSIANVYGVFTPSSADAEFTWRSVHDTYLGSVSSTDRVVTLKANAGKVQIAYFDHCTIDSSTTVAFGKRSAIYTTGAGNPAVHVRNLSSSTAWGMGRYESETGSITDYTGGRWYKATYDPPTLGAGEVDATQTISAPGAKVGDDVRTVFSQALQGLRLDGWVSADDEISYRFSNPGPSAVNLLPGTVRASFTSPVT